MPDQAKQQSEPQNFDEYFDAGWKAMETEVAQAASDSKKAEADTAAKAAEEECPDCPKKGETKAPFKVLKHRGKEVPIHTEKELMDLAQQGFDYTKKRQEDSDDRRKWEEDYNARVEEFNRRTEELTQRLDRLSRGGESPAEETIPPEEKVYQEYGLDEYAEPFQKKMAADLASVKKQNEQLQQALAAFYLDKEFRDAKEAIIKEREANPFEEIVDESGKNQTAEEFKSIMISKAQEYGGRKPFVEMARETIRDISKRQLMQKEKMAAQGGIPAKMTRDELKTRFPELYEQLEKEIRDQALASYAEETSKLPPGIKKFEGDIGKKEPSARKGFKSFDEALDAAFEDSEVNKMFGGK